jgi:hypothetical protein
MQKDLIQQNQQGYDVILTIISHLALAQWTFQGQLRHPCTQARRLLLRNQ